MIAAGAARCESPGSAYPDPMNDSPRILLFDIDGTLVSTGGAGAVAWKQAFEELHGIPADIGEFTDAGMTDPDVGEKTFEAVMGRKPSPRELAQLIQRRLEHLPEAIAQSEGYRVLPGVPERLRQLSRDGHLLGLITGNGDGAAFVKLSRGDLMRWFSFGAYATAGVKRADIVRRAVERGEATLGGRRPELGDLRDRRHAARHRGRARRGLHRHRGGHRPLRRRRRCARRAPTTCSRRSRRSCHLLRHVTNAC